MTPLTVLKLILPGEQEALFGFIEIGVVILHVGHKFHRVMLGQVISHADPGEITFIVIAIVVFRAIRPPGEAQQAQIGAQWFQDKCAEIAAAAGDIRRFKTVFRRRHAVKTRLRTGAMLIIWSPVL